jgi:hypothetical protein
MHRRCDRKEPEYQLLDTGMFEGDRYFDVFFRVCQVRARGPAGDAGTQDREAFAQLLSTHEIADGSSSGLSRAILRLLNQF